MNQVDLMNKVPMNQDESDKIIIGLRAKVLSLQREMDEANVLVDKARQSIRELGQLIRR